MKYFMLFEHFRNFHSLKSPLFERFLGDQSGNSGVFVSRDEETVQDMAQQELLTDSFDIVEKSNPLFEKMEQHASTSEGETILELNEHLLTKFDTPFEFIRWDRLGSDKKPIETSFFVKDVDKKRI